MKETIKFNMMLCAVISSTSYQNAFRLTDEGKAYLRLLDEKTEVNPHLLRLCYGVFVQAYNEDDLKVASGIKIYMPDLFAYMGRRRNQSKDRTRYLINELEKLGNYTRGVLLDSNDNPHEFNTIDVTYFEDHNCVLIKSEYFISLLKCYKSKAYMHTYRISPHLFGEKNRAAAENVLSILLLNSQTNSSLHNSACKCQH